MPHSFRIDLPPPAHRLLMWLSARLAPASGVFRRRVAVGSAAVDLAKGGDAAQYALERFVVVADRAAGGHAARLRLAAYVAVRWFNYGQGSGIPQIIASNELPSNSKTRENMVSMRVAMGKSVMLISCSHAAPPSGAKARACRSARRSCCSRAGGGHPPRGRVLMAGGAAGVAGAFNTPLAGVVFAIEELGAATSSAPMER